jgi:hypothetical protein
MYEMILVQTWKKKEKKLVSRDNLTEFSGTHIRMTHKNKRKWRIKNRKEVHTSVP